MGAEKEKTMGDMPEKIWAHAEHDDEPKYGAFWAVWHGVPSTEYRRADLPPTLEQALMVPEVQDLVTAANGYRNAIDAFDGSGSITNKIAVLQAWRDTFDAALRGLEGGE